MHQLGVLPCEEDDTVAPRSVPEDGPSVDDFLVVQTVLLPAQAQFPLELGQIIVGRLADDVAVKLYRVMRAQLDVKANDIEPHAPLNESATDDELFA